MRAPVYAELSFKEIDFGLFAAQFLVFHLKRCGLQDLPCGGDFDADFAKVCLTVNERVEHAQKFDAEFFVICDFGFFHFVFVGSLPVA